MNDDTHPQPLQIEARWLAALSASQLVALIARLLRAEAARAGIPLSAIHVPTNLDTPDGGEDGRVHWSGGPPSTEGFPGRFVQFQLKAGDMAPAKVKRELVDASGALKPMVRQALEAGGHYRMICTQSCTQQMIDARVEKMRAALAEGGLASAAERANFIDATHLATWVNAFPAVARWLRAERQLVDGGAFRTLEDELANGRHRRSPTLFDRRLPEIRKAVRSRADDPQSITRVVGPPRVGSTRLVLDALSPSDAEDAEGHAFNALTLYAAVEDRAPSVLATVNDLARSGCRAVIIVDGVSASVHEQLLAAVNRDGSRLSLVSLMADFRQRERGERTELVVVPDAPDGLIRSLIEQRRPAIHSIDRDRLVRLAAGYPSTAITMAELWGDEAFAALLSDDALGKRLLVGSDPASEMRKYTDAATLVALFGPVPLESETNDWIERLGPLVSEASPTTLRAALNDLVARGVCRKDGQLLKLERLELIGSLASAGWSAWTRRLWDEILGGAVLSNDMTRNAATRLAELNTTGVAQTVARHVCRPDGPFGTPEGRARRAAGFVLERLAEIDSASVFALLKFILRREGRGAWAELGGRVQVAFATALARETVPANGFERGARLLLDLAVIECQLDEHSRGPATTRLEALFPRAGAATEAMLEQRTRFLDDELESADVDRLRVLVEAVVNGVETGSYVGLRTTEPAGTRPWIEPDRNLDDDAMCQRVVATGDWLARVGEREDAVGADARRILGRQARGALRAGLEEPLERWIEGLRRVGRRWPEASRSIGEFLIWAAKNDTARVPRGQALLQRLLPRDLEDRLRESISQSPAIDPETAALSDEAGERYADARLTELAEALAASWRERPALLDQLSRGRQYETGKLGRRLIALENDPWKLVHAAERAWLGAPSAERSSELIAGIAEGLAEADDERVERWKTELGASPDRAPLLPAVLSTAGTTEADLSLMIDALQEGRVSATDCASARWPWHSIQTIDPVALVRFVRTVIDLDRPLAVDVISKYVDRRPASLVPFDDVLLELAARGDSALLDNSRFASLLRMMLDRDGSDVAANSLAACVGRQLVELPWKAAYTLKGSLFHRLLDRHPRATWSAMHESAGVDPQRVEQLARIFSHSAGPWPRASRIWSLPNDAAFTWGSANPNLALPALASLVPLFENDTDTDGSEAWTVSPVLVEFLCRFGEDELLHEILIENLWMRPSAGRRTHRTWAPLVEPLRSLANHPERVVRRWAATALDIVHEAIASLPDPDPF